MIFILLGPFLDLMLNNKLPLCNTPMGYFSYWAQKINNCNYRMKRLLAFDLYNYLHTLTHTRVILKLHTWHFFLSLFSTFCFSLDSAWVSRSGYWSVHRDTRGRGAGRGAHWHRAAASSRTVRSIIASESPRRATHAELPRRANSL